MKKLSQLVAFFSGSCLIVFFLFPARALAAPARTIRVAITQHAETLQMRVAGGFEVIDSSTRLMLYRGENLNTTVTASGRSVLLGEIKVTSPRFLIRPFYPDAVTIDGRRFRDNIEFTRKQDGTLLVVNVINLEDYIKGILFHETSHYWPMEVLKSQAIVCRTYALYQLQENKAQDFDVTNDIYSQVYGGRGSERHRTNKAVDETKNLVLVYQGALIPAYFHATCGGHTEDASLVWKIKLPCLSGVACSWCKDSPHFNWHCVLELGELRQRLVNAGYSLGVIKRIAIEGRDASGRITDLHIVSSRNEISVSSKDFRAAVGPNELRSTNFTVALEGQDAVFEGVGWGHGVGMCQWGAYFFAKQGARYSQILEYYYPGSNISSI